MKKFILLITLFIFSERLFSATFYLKAAGGNLLTDRNNWGSNSNGNGSIPSVNEFTAQAHIYIITNVTTATLSTPWQLGSGSTIQVGNTGATELIITGAGSITNATINVADGSAAGVNNKLNIQSTTQSLTAIGTLGTTFAADRISTVEFNSTTSLLIPDRSYGTLIISGVKAAGSIITFGAAFSIAGNFTISATGTYTINEGTGTVTYDGKGAQTIVALQYFNLTVSGARSASSVITLQNSGTIKIKGTFSVAAAAAGTFTWASASSTVEYNNATAGTNQPVVDLGSVGYNNLSMTGGYGGTRTFSGSTLAIAGILTISGGVNSTTNLMTFDTGTAAITGAFTTACPLGTYGDVPGYNILKIGNTSLTPIPTGKTYHFSVEYNSTSAQTVMAGTYVGQLIIAGARSTNNVTCESGGIYNVKWGNHINGFLAVNHTATYTSSGAFVPSTSTFVLNKDGGQNFQSSAQYYNVTIAGTGEKNLSSTKVSNILSVQGDAYSIGSPNYTLPATTLEYRNFTTPTRSRSSIDESWKKQIFGGARPTNIRVADGAIINIDDINASQNRMEGCNLEIIGTGRVNVNNNCRIDIFQNLTTSGGGQLGGVAGSRIHISGNSTVNIGKINTSGYVCLDKDFGTATFLDNLNASDTYVWNPIDGGFSTAGVYSFNLAASITSGTLTMGQSAPGTPAAAAAWAVGVGVANGTLLLNNIALGSGATHTHTITGNVTIIDGIIDFSSTTIADNLSVILNIAGNFTKTGGIFQTSSVIGGVGNFGLVKFNGTTQNIHNTTISTSTKEVTFWVTTGTSTLTNNFALGPNAESWQTFSGATLDVGTRVISGAQNGGYFTLNGGATLRTAHLSGINSDSPSASNQTRNVGNIQTQKRYFSSLGNYEYNGAAAQNTGTFLTEGTAFTVNNLVVNNASNVTGQQDFTVNGACNLTSGKFVIGSFTTTLNGTLTNTATNSFSANGLSNMVVGPNAAGLGNSIFFDQTNPGKSTGTGPTDYLELTPGTTNRLNNLTMNRTGQIITLGNEVQVTNVLTPTAGTLASAGNLVMLSTASGTSSILALGAGASITGNVNVQSYFTGGSVASNRGFRMISSPTNNPATFFSDLKNRFIITGQGAIAGGFDIDPNLAPNAATIQTYNEPSTAGAGSYVPLTNITNTMQVGKGYYFFFRGNRNYLSTATNTKINSPFRAPENWTATYIGTVNQGSITSPTVTRTTGSTDGYVGLNLIGNLYPATLDFDAFLATNTGKIDDYLSIMNNVRTGYVTRSGGVTNGYFTTTPVSTDQSTLVVSPLRFIQPGQGFMIRNKSTISSTTLSFLESHKASAANSANVRRLLSLNENGVSLTDNSGSNVSKKTNEAPAERKLIRLSVDNGDTLRDDVTIVLEDGNDASYGGYDAPYFSNGALSCYTLTSDEKKAVINFMPAVSQVDSIKVAVNSNANYDNLKLSFTELTGLGDKQLLLKDKYLNTLTKIGASTKSYNFAIDRAQKATFGAERFVLVFVDADALPAKVKNLNADAVNNGVVLKWNTQSELNGAEFVVERSSDGINFETIGTVAMVGTSEETRTYKFVDESPLNGTNIYRLKKVGEDGSFTYTGTASAQFGLLAEGKEIAVYPSNPTEILNITWKTNERVNIEIFDMTGRLVRSHKNVRAGLYRENVSGFATGMYVVKLYAYTNNRLMSTDKFIKQ